MKKGSRPRIAGIGDSTTAGTPGFRSPIEAPPDGAGDVTSQYAYWLMQQRPDWLVLNQGVNGERTDQIAARFDRDVIGGGADAAVIIAGVNDIDQGRSAASILHALAAMYDAAANAGIAIVAGSIIPYNTATALQNARMHEVNAWIRSQAARRPHFAFCDTRAAVAAPGDPDRLAESTDELHPTPAGYRAMALALEPVIGGLLESRRARS